MYLYVYLVEKNELTYVFKSVIKNLDLSFYVSGNTVVIYVSMCYLNSVICTSSKSISIIFKSKN